MNLCFDQSLGLGYKSNSQKIRVMSESWVNDNIFCPVCGNARISKLENNRPVADFQCPSCGEIFELKSKDGRIGRKISDGAYDTMISRITSMTNPDLLVMHYSSLQVVDLTVVPKFFFTPTVIEKRKPLSPTARRAGWVGAIFCTVIFQNKGESLLLKIRISAVRIVSYKTMQESNVCKRDLLKSVDGCLMYSTV